MAGRANARDAMSGRRASLGGQQHPNAIPPDDNATWQPVGIVPSGRTPGATQHGPEGRRQGCGPPTGEVGETHDPTHA